MRKHFWIGSLLAVFLSAVFVFSAFSNTDRADGITLLSPSACPSGGCAAGQRLDFSVNFPLSPSPYNPWVQVCVYAPSGGWADFSTGWISDEGIDSGIAYTLGDPSGLCAAFTPTNYESIVGVHTPLTPGLTHDSLDFVLNIDTTSTTSGDVHVIVFEPDDQGYWGDTSNFTSPTISVAPHASTVYVANTAVECGSNSPCFVNSGDDLASGLGTGLRDAVNAASAGDSLQILGDYNIKNEAVLIDQAVTLTGLQDADLSYGGSTCSEPMLSVTSGASIQNLTLDGTCGSSHRTLIDIDSTAPVAVEHNTLINGNLGVHLQDNTGSARVAFNALENNTGYAVYKEGSSGDVSIYANNIIGNGGSYQVNCNNAGSADHNFWGANETATSNALYCSASNGKQLGAAIDTTIGTPGVSAEQVTVTMFKQYAFGGEIAYAHDGGSNYDLIIVNHGQGDDENVPFFNTLGNSVTPCSDFYDVFLPEGVSPSVLNLYIEYNAACESAIESAYYCGSGVREDAPLWWYDPANNVTEYWDTTGQAPDGLGAGGTDGQGTYCNSTLNEISVEIDGSTSRHPNLVSDLNFTPFVVGLQNDGSVNLSQFTVTFDGSDNKVRWTTTAENNISGFHVLRSDTENGTYSRISSLIPAIGDSNIGGIYYYTDESIQFTRTYYYKLEVANKQGESIEFYGPVSVLTSTATPTSTMTRTPTKTRTPYPTRTSTPYYYRSPTSYYRRATATPLGGPTRVRTYGPTPTPSRTSATKPTYNPSQSSSSGYPAEGYPVGTQMPPNDSGYPPNGEGGYQVSTQVPSSEQGSSGEQGDNPSSGDSESGEQGSSQGGQQSQPGSQSIQWPFLALGAISGVLILAGVGFLLIKTRFN